MQEKKIRIGAPNFLSMRPLLFGLTRNPDRGLELIYNEPSKVASLLEQSRLDAALVPSIEFLRGVGEHYIRGPAFVARQGAPSMVMIARVPVEKIRRIAVDEFSRTPIAVLRIVLDSLYGILPDICVAKNAGEDWEDRFDAILLGGDRGLEYLFRKRGEGGNLYDISEMWHSVTSLPLVISLWVYNNKGLESMLTKALIASRNLGVKNLKLLSEGIAQTSAYSAEFLYDAFNNNWSYDMGGIEIEGLKALEAHALRYKLIRKSRWGEEVHIPSDRPGHNAPST